MRTTIKSAIAAATSMLAAIAMGDIATALDAPDLEFATSADESCAEWTEQSYPFAVGGTAARSGVCVAEDDGWMDWTSELGLYEIEGPCTLSFSYAARSPYSNSASSWSDGTFYVYVDGEEVLSKYANSDVLTWLSMFESFPDYLQQTPLKEYKITLGHGKHDEVVWSFCGYGYGISSPEEQAYAIVDNVKVTPAPESMKITFVTGDGETIAPMMVNPGKTYGELPTPNHDTLDFVGWYRDPYFVCRADDDALVSYEDQTLYARYGLPASVLDTEDLAFSADSGWFVAADAGTGGIPALTTSGKGPLIVRTCGAGTITFKEKDSYRSASLGVSEHWGEGVCWKSSYSYPLDGEGRPDWACGILIGTITVRSGKEEYFEFAVGGSYISSDDYLAQYMSAIEAGYETSELPAFHPVLYDFEWTPAPEFQTVTFETNGGVPIESLRLSTSEPIDWSILPNPKWEDHIFCGWYRDPDLTSTIPSTCNTALPIYDFTVYAKWALPISAMDTDDITFSSDSWCAYKGGAGGLKAGVVSDLNCEWIEDPILEVTTRGPGTLTFAGTGSPVDVSVNGGDETSVGSYVVYVTGGWPATLIVSPVGETENKIRIRSSYYSDSRLFDFAWTPAPESMIVSFDTAGGGKVFPATRTYTPGDVFGSLPTPKRTGCRFLGWWFADDAMYTETSSRTAETDMLVPFHDFTLKARWASEKVTILPSEFTNVEFLSWESGEEQQGRWGEIVAADGSRTLEMYTAVVGNGISFVEGEIQADVTCGGFLSFEINGFYEAAVRISDDKGKTICERSVENVEVSEPDWTKVRIAIPAGNFHIAIQGTGYWFPGLRDGVLRNFVFEPLGPQESLAAWIGKLVDYKCWNEGDLARFVKDYEDRFTAKPSDYEARISHAVAVLANLAESDTVKNYAARFGATFDYFRLKCETDATDTADWPEANELVDAAFAEAIPALASATADLMSIPEDWNGTVRLAAADYSFLDEDVAIDRADVLYARAAVEAAIGLLYFAKGYDWTTNWETLRGKKSRADIVHNLVMDQGDLLADIRDASALEESRDWMEAALKMALDADTAAQLRTDGVMHLVEYDPAYASVQAKARNLTQKALLSLDSTQMVNVVADIVGEDGTCDVTLLPDNGFVRMYIGALFSGRIVHDLAPTVSVERRKGKSLAVPDFYSMTDPTLAGLMPDFTAKKWTMIYDEATNATHAVRCHRPKAGTVYSAAHFVMFFPAGADSEPVVQEFVGDSPQTLAPCGFVRPGFEFAGWATRENGAALYGDGQKVSVYADLMLYALWTVNQYTVTFNANGGIGGTAVTQNYGTSLVAPVVTRTGYTFKGWSPSVPAKVPAGNATYVAQWTANKYTVTFDANDGEGGWSRAMDYGSSIVVPTVTRTGYTFTGWSSAVASTVPAGNVIYIAQ